MQTCDNDGDYSGNIYRASYHAFLSEHPSYQLLYFDSLDPVAVEDNADSDNMVLPNVKLSNDSSALVHPPLDNYTRPRCIRIYSREN